LNFATFSVDLLVFFVLWFYRAFLGTHINMVLNCVHLSVYMCVCVMWQIFNPLKNKKNLNYV